MNKLKLDQVEISFHLLLFDFGSISGLLASRFNFKLSITTPIALLHLYFLGTATSVFATPSNLNYAHYLNLPDSKTDSQTILDLEKFYLNNNEDTFYLIPKMFPIQK